MKFLSYNLCCIDNGMFLFGILWILKKFIFVILIIFVKLNILCWCKCLIFLKLLNYLKY